jgi:serpin B
MKLFVLPILFAVTLSATDAPLADSMNTFTANIYKQLARADENLILSPFNIATALSMVLAGSRGLTAQEIQSVLHLSNDTATPAAWGAMLADLAKAGNTEGNELLTANGVWVQKGFPVQPAFESTLSDSYLAPPAPVDFIGASEAARSRINEWTEEHTKGKIKNLFPAGSLNSHTRLVLSSAIYFYGRWQTPFLTTRTQPAPFILPTGTTTQADFMNQTSRFGYTETPSAQILEMRYAQTGIAFDVLLPKTVSGLPDLEKSLTKDTLTGWVGKLSSRKVQVSLPKFRVESQFSLTKALSLLGMPTAFTDKADFSGISPKGPLWISEAVHKAFVDVSEQGTEAAAATGLRMTYASARAPDQVVVFRADHPFLFLIRDTRSEAILFMGRLTNPHI